MLFFKSLLNKKWINILIDKEKNSIYFHLNKIIIIL